MLADFYSKPLQGGLFRWMRDVVMGLQPISILYDKNTEHDEKLVSNNNQEHKEEIKIKPMTLTDRKERVEKNVLSERVKTKYSGCVKDHKTGKNKSYAEAVCMTKLSQL